MKAYRIIDSRERNSKEELKLYTIEQIKEFFRPDKELAEEDPEQASKFEKIADISDLEDYLTEQAAGMAQPYKFEEIEVESLEELERKNNILNDIDSHGFINKWFKNWRIKDHEIFNS